MKAVLIFQFEVVSPKVTRDWDEDVGQPKSDFTNKGGCWVSYTCLKGEGKGSAKKWGFLDGVLRKLPVFHTGKRRTF